MSDIAQQNLDILGKRWPELAGKVLASSPPQNMYWEGDQNQPTLSVEGRRLWSAFDTDSEARIQASMIPADADRAWVYGVGSGDLVRELLKRDRLQQLFVVPLHLGLMHFLMHSLDNRDWMSDERVELHDANSQPRVFEPCAVIPPCLALADRALSGLREKLAHTLLKPYERERVRLREPLRKAQIRQNLDLLRQDGDVNTLFETQPGSPAFVALAGPSLKKTIARLIHDSQGKIVIAVDGALKPLLDANVVPDVVVSIDDHRENILRYFDADLGRCTDSTLVYTPIVHHDALVRWPGRRLAMYCHEAIYDDLRDEFPRSDLFVAGSVAHPAIDLAVKMGSTRIYLFGADFGFPDGEIHANSAAPIDFYSDAAKAGVTVMNGRGEPIPTLASFNGYRAGMEDYITRHPDTQFINTSRDGAYIQGASYVDEVEH
jgi:hypothetical protein